MSLLDIIVLLLVIGFGVLGFFTGVLRRLIGLVALFVALFAASNMGLQAGGILQQTGNVETPDARIYGFFGIMVIVLVLIEGAGQLAHSQIQIPAVVLNRATGVLVGLVTAIMLAVVVTNELQAAGNPFGGGQLDNLQARIRDTVSGSSIAVPVTRAIGKPILTIFQPVLPGSPQIYFGPGPVT